MIFSAPQPARCLIESLIGRRKEGKKERRKEGKKERRKEGKIERFLIDLVIINVKWIGLMHRVVKERGMVV